MFFRVIVIGCALWLSIPANARQTSLGEDGSATRLRKSPLTADNQLLLPPPSGPFDISGAPPRSAFAQGTPAGKASSWLEQPDEPGSWIAWEITCDIVTNPLRAAWEKQLKAIAALVRDCPVFRDIRGYYPMLSGCVNVDRNTSVYGGTVALGIWPPKTVERTSTGEPRIKGEWRYNQPGENSRLLVNDYGDLDFWWSHYEDREGRFYELPETSREIAGFPVIGGFLFVSLPSKPPLFTPITRERAQRWIIDNLRRQADADAIVRPGDEPLEHVGIDLYRDADVEIVEIIDVADYEPRKMSSKTWRECINQK